MNTRRETSRIGSITMAVILGLALGVLPGATSKLRSEQLSKAGESAAMRSQQIVFGTYAEDADALYWILVMVESVREFGGSLRHVPVWVYLPDDQPELGKAPTPRPVPEGVTFKRSNTPAEAKPFWFAGKVFAAALAEAEAVGHYQLLAWLDPDVIFVKEPRDFLLPDSVSLGYRPVMHKLIGSRYSEPPDEFWSRVYDQLEVPVAAIFPVVTPVDQETIRAYFNAGLLVLRPEMGVLRKWPVCFATLYSDSVFIGWCKQNRLMAIFLHQAALAGDLLSTLTKQDMVELSDAYNYSVYLEDKYPPAKRPRSVDDVIMFRHESIFNDSTGLAKIKNAAKMYPWVKARVLKK